MLVFFLMFRGLSHSKKYLVDIKRHFAPFFLFPQFFVLSLVDICRVRANIKAINIFIKKCQNFYLYLLNL